MKNFKLLAKPPALYRDYQGLQWMKFILVSPLSEARPVCIGFLDPDQESKSGSGTLGESAYNLHKEKEELIGKSV
jgi:hypothetical protein